MQGNILEEQTKILIELEKLRLKKKRNMRNDN